MFMPGTVSPYLGTDCKPDARHDTGVQAIQHDTGDAVAAIEQISEIVAQGSGQIAENISGVSTGGRLRHQASTQTRSAVDELSRMAADLRTTVGHFTY
jgi:methyl-accepting chemotaxis protein